jgi:formamidopyrimidine-DNA glycosylase
MNELPETHTIAHQINDQLMGKTIHAVIAAASPHKFAWYYGDPAEYSIRLTGSIIKSAADFGMMVEISLTHSTLVFSDGVRLRWHPAAGRVPNKHQLLCYFDDETALSASIAMYGGLFCWEIGTDFDDDYYRVAKEKPSPLVDAFDESYFEKLLTAENVLNLSLKAALATEQRIPGLGNGCLQDILWRAGLHPRRKIKTITVTEIGTLFSNLKATLAEMAAKGGRSTEKDLFGKAGAYQVLMCHKNQDQPCPRCGDFIHKESYMGGSIYVCPTCQPG